MINFLGGGGGGCGGGGGGVGEWVQNPDSPRGARLRRLNPSVCTPLRNGPATPPGWGVGGGGGDLSFERGGDARRLA